MTTIRIGIRHPSTGSYLDGSVTFTAQHANSPQAVLEGGDVISGVPVRVEVSGAESTVNLIPSPPGWWYRAQVRDASGWAFSEHVRVPGEVTERDFGDLERIDPKAAAPWTPDPEWWSWARRIEALGGIPGLSAKEVVEKFEDRSFSDTEFIAYITGPRGDEGTPGLDGLTALDFFRQDRDDPTATVEQMWEWLRGRTALEQWATLEGLDPESVEVADMVEAFTGQSAFEAWKENEERPDATFADFMIAHRGPKGDASFVEGPVGPRGRSVYDLAVASGFEGTEEEFAGMVLGSEPPWVSVNPINGWSTTTADPLRYRALDGKIHWKGRLNRSSSDHFRVISGNELPSSLRPEREEHIHVISSRSNSARFVLYPNGDFYLSSFNQGQSDSWFYFDSTYPISSIPTRSRIPGVQGADGRDGRSAAEAARSAGWGGTDSDFAARMATLASLSEADWQRWIDENERTTGPEGPRGLVGPQGSEGPRGGDGRSAHDAVVASGYSLSESEFADSMLGAAPDWEEPTLWNGWTSPASDRFRWRVVDGMVQVRGTLNRSDNPGWNIARKPDEFWPPHDAHIEAHTNNGARVLFTAHADSNDFRLHVDHRETPATTYHLNTFYMATLASMRPRIAGPQGATGRSAAQSARDAGWAGTDSDFAARMAAIAHISAGDWARFTQETVLSTGPSGETAFQIARRHGFTGSEADFAQSLIGEYGDWRRRSTLNGWTSGDEGLRWRRIDGRIEWAATLGVGTKHWRITSGLPTDLRPSEDAIIRCVTDTGSVVRIRFDVDGGVYLHEDDRDTTATLVYLDASYPGRGGLVRPRVPGAPGRSAFDHAKDRGYQGTEVAFGDALSVLAEEGVGSSSVGRIVVSTNASTPLSDGDILLVIEEQ